LRTAYGEWQMAFTVLGDYSGYGYSQPNLNLTLALNFQTTTQNSNGANDKTSTIYNRNILKLGYFNSIVQSRSPLVVRPLPSNSKRY